MDPGSRGQRYLEHLTRADRELLVRVAGGLVGVGIDDLHHRPEHVEALLAAPAAYDAVFAPSADQHETLVGVSPFLTFGVAVHRARLELAGLSYVHEWTGPRQRVPVFATDELRTFLDEPGHRLFLVELLASYTHVAGGAIAVRRHGVVYRYRFSELDLTALARLIDLVDEATRPGLYRRLGDLALLLTGVFPDHTARSRFAPIDVDRLARALRPASVARAEALHDALTARGAVGFLEDMGRRWYRLALDHAGVETATLATLRSVGDRFVEARRVLNHLTDRHLFPLRARWFPSPN